MGKLGALALLIACFYLAIIRAADEDGCKILRKAIIEPIDTEKNAKDLSFVEIGEEWQDSNTASWGCIDSKSSIPMLFTAGGDSGEFILALTIYDKLNNQALSSMLQDELNLAVFNLLTAFINTTSTARKIYLHINQNTVTALTTFLHNPSLSIDCVPSELWTQALIPLTQNSSFTGCNHVQLMQSHSSDYETSPRIIEAFLRAFYTLHWINCNKDNRSTVLFISNLASTTEFAVLNIYTEKTRLSKDDKCYNMLPSAVLLQPDDDLHRSVLILHDAIHQEGIRPQLAQFFAEQTPNLNADAFLTAANALGDKQKELTLHFIAPSLPVFIYKIVMGENRADERDEMEETFVEVSLIIIFVILACIGGFFLYRTYKQRNSREKLLTINDLTITAAVR